MKPVEKEPLAPRETVLRMLAHLPENASYAEIIRQVRILQDIEKTLKDVEPGMVGLLDDDSMAVEGGRRPLPSYEDFHTRDPDTRTGSGSTGHRRRLPDLLLREATWID